MLFYCTAAGHVNWADTALLKNVPVTGSYIPHLLSLLRRTNNPHQRSQADSVPPHRGAGTARDEITIFLSQHICVVLSEAGLGRTERSLTSQFIISKAAVIQIIPTQLSAIICTTGHILDISYVYPRCRQSL